MGFQTYLRPWHAVLGFLLVYLGLVLTVHSGDPMAFVRLGNGPNEGYDGQFTYLIAVDPDPHAVAHAIGDVRSDVPAYRYQRILLPALARLAALGRVDWVAWTIPAINVVAHSAGTAFVGRLLARHGVSVWYALVYGLWPGLLLGVRADLTEPLSYAFVGAGYLLHWQLRRWPSALCFALAIFAKETAVLFAAAQIASATLRRDWQTVISHLSLVLAPVMAWQIALAGVFGQIGFGSGGYLATPFETVPFNGLWRIAGDSTALFLVFLVVLGPTVVAPAVWGIFASVRTLGRGNWHPYVFALAACAAIVPFTPFSTFREPGAMLRLSTGLVLSTMLFATEFRRARVVHISWFWLVMLVFLRE